MGWMCVVVGCLVEEKWVEECSRMICQLQVSLLLISLVGWVYCLFWLMIVLLVVLDLKVISCVNLHSTQIVYLHHRGISA